MPQSFMAWRMASSSMSLPAVSIADNNVASVCSGLGLVLPSVMEQPFSGRSRLQSVHQVFVVKADLQILAVPGDGTLVGGVADARLGGRLLYERVERLFRREVRRVAGDARPEQRRAVRRVVARHTAHACHLAAHVVLDAFQLLRVVAPRHHVEVGADGLQPLRVRFVQVFFNPLAVDGVLAAVPGERLHVPRRFLEAAQFLVYKSRQIGYFESKGSQAREEKIGAHENFALILRRDLL